MGPVETMQIAPSDHASPLNYKDDINEGSSTQYSACKPEVVLFKG